MSEKMLNIFRVIFLSVIGILIPAFVLWRNIFPVFISKYTATDTRGLKLIEKKYNDEETYFFSGMPGLYPFSSLDFSLNLEDKKIDPKEYDVELAKEYIASSYPIGKEILTEEELRDFLYFDNPSDLPNGTLFSYGGSAYFVSRGAALPIVGPEVFEGLGWQWDKILPKSSDALVSLKAGDRISFYSSHPDGTFLKTKDGELFLVWEDQRLPVKEEMLRKIWPQYHVVSIDRKNLEFSRTCHSRIQEGELACQFDLNEELLNRPGKYFILRVRPMLDQTIIDGRTELNVKINFKKGYWSYVLGQIKFKLKLKYAELFAK